MYQYLHASFLLFAFLLLATQQVRGEVEGKLISGTVYPNSVGVEERVNATPGARHLSSLCSTDQYLWLFGGYAIDTALATGWTGDLWQYDKVAGTWAWVAGNPYLGALASFPPAPSFSPSANVTAWPGARNAAAMWVDGDALWLFGGYGVTNTTTKGYLNDLWKYNITEQEWYWIGGSPSVNGAGSNPPVNTTSPTAFPGARSSMAYVFDGSDFWMFGGTSSSSSLSELWRYHVSTNQWYLVSEGTLGAGSYNTSTVTFPGARSGSAIWRDQSGHIWVYGGIGYDSNSSVGQLSDMWKFDQAQGEWTFSGSSLANDTGIYSSDLSAYPGARSFAAYWSDGSNLWLFGGYGSTNSSVEGVTNDLWQFDVSLGKWIWASGSATTNQPGYYNNNPSDHTNINLSTSGSGYPGSRQQAAFFGDSTGAWVVGGNGVGSNGTGDLADVWHYVSATWQYAGATTTSGGMMVPLLRGASVVEPLPSNSYGAFLVARSADELWMFSGFGASSFVTDIWAYNITSNVWTHKGVLDGLTTPSPRLLGVGWVSDDTFWLFGGSGELTYNDMWKFDFTTLIWTPVRNQTGIDIYPAQGSTTPSATPSPRQDASFWVIGRDVWVFGGYVQINMTFGTSNDLWRYNMDEDAWYFMHGQQQLDVSGIYDNSSQATPCTRYGPVHFAYNGSLWIYGGIGAGLPLSDLWSYSIADNRWTWVDGDTSDNGSYPALGTTEYGAYPFSRTDAVGWADGDSFYVLGGTLITNSMHGELNDLWRYDFQTGLWYYLAGSPPIPTGVPYTATYGSTVRGGTSQSATCVLNGGVYIFGGFGVPPQSPFYAPYKYTADLWFYQNVIIPTTTTTTTTTATSTTDTTTTTTASSTTTDSSSTTTTDSSSTTTTDSSSTTSSTSTTSDTSSTASSTTSTTSSTTSTSTGSVVSVCGNGVTEVGEQCDSNSSCCDNTTCLFRAAGYTCREARGVCDEEETCTGSSAECPVDMIRPSNVVCRNSTGLCNIAAVCGGSNSSCPPSIELQIDSCGVCGGDGTSCQSTGICGDGVCNVAIKENCETCYLDCGPCAPISCPKNCSNNGECNNGLCTCENGYYGPACDQSYIIVVTKPSPTQPSLRVQPDPSEVVTEVTFSVNVIEVREVEPDGTVVNSILLNETNVEVMSKTIDNVTTWTYDLHLDSGADLYMTFMMASVPTTIDFANQTYDLQPSILKSSISISYWSFETIKNQLQLVYELGTVQDQPQTTNCFTPQADAGGNVRSVQYTVDGVTMYGTFLQNALVDQEPRPLQVALSEEDNRNLIVLTLPHFWVNAVIDPDYSVLIQPEDTNDPCHYNQASNKAISTAIIASASVSAAFVFTGGVLASFFALKRRREFDQKMRELENRQSQGRSSAANWKPTGSTSDLPLPPTPVLSHRSEIAAPPSPIVSPLAHHSTRANAVI